MIFVVVPPSPQHPKSALAVGKVPPAQGNLFRIAVWHVFCVPKWLDMVEFDSCRSADIGDDQRPSNLRMSWNDLA